VFLTGFLFLDESETWRPSAKLSEFIAAGPPPVYVGFGSMNAFADRPTLEKILTTVLKTGERVLFSAGRDHIGLAHELGVDARRVFNLGIAPHGWLFPRTKAIVHHGGAGTTAAALAAGVPSVIIPFLSDQFFWGNRMYALGAAPEPIPFRRLQPRRLADALRLATQDTIIRKNAADIGRMLRSEDGVARAVDLIRRLS
jgi:sterol 3beta-glucosyltransferase